MRALPMLRALGHPVVFDVTHSLQLPGAGDGVTSGAGRIHRAARARRRRRRRRRRLHGGARGSRRGQERRRPTRSGSIGSSRCCGAWSRLIGSPRRMPDLSLARKVLQTEAAAVLALVDRLDERFARGRDARPRLPGPRDRHRHGQVRHHRAARSRRRSPSTGTAGVLPAPGRSAARRPRRHPRRRRRHRAVVQRREPRSSCGILETLEAAGRALIAITGVAGLDAGAGRRRHARLPGVRRGVPDEPRADGEHDGDAGARRRAGDDRARREGLSARRLRAPASRAASWASRSCASSS